VPIIHLRVQILSCRGEHNRIGCALQLISVRYVGTLSERSGGGARIRAAIPVARVGHPDRRPAALSQVRTPQGFWPIRFCCPVAARWSASGSECVPGSRPVYGGCW